MLVVVTFKEEKEVLAKFDEIAKQRGTDRSALIREGIRRTIKEN